MGQFFSAEFYSWCLKCAYLLIAPDTKASDQHLQLPSLEDISTMCVTQEHPVHGAFCPMHYCTSGMMDLFLFVALLCEKLGRHSDAVAYAGGCFFDISKGGGYLPATQILAHSVRGRALAALGEQMDAARELEAAVEMAHQYSYRLWEAFALRDLKLLVLDQMGHGDHGSRRLGAVLRLLKGPAELLTPMMKGLDAEELMSLPAPEAGCEVVYDEDPAAAAEAALRHNLELGV